jgi:hypothetical protein
LDTGVLAAILSSVAAIVASLIAVAYQFFQFRRQVELSDAAKIAAQKQKVIEGLISYRYVLTGNALVSANDTGVHGFNRSLSQIPVYFSHNKTCMDCYRSIGDDFTSEKYYNLIVALMSDVPLNAGTIDRHLLENVPSFKYPDTRNPK